jgi:DNA replicative helicase MCM subunit Mcm2 (Cdc46/Mcm family)
MREKKPSKYTIREKTPLEDQDARPSKKLLKKLKKERKKLKKERKKWEKVIKRIQKYNTTIEDLEDKRKSIEKDIRDLLKEKKKAKERIKEFYLELRGQYNKEDEIVSILARNLDALVRLSEAYAKMALRNLVSKEDVDEIIKIFKKYLKDTGYDKETGKIDADLILMGQSRSKTNKLTRIYDRIKILSEENNWKELDKNSVIQILEVEENLDKSFIKNAIEEAIKEGTLYEPKPNKIKMTERPD